MDALGAILILPGIPVIVAPQTLLWLFVVGAIAGFIVAYGIGANDVANAFGTSVGSGAITMRWAIILASIMEFTGAISLGHSVTQTIRSGIADEKCFEKDQSELMLGMVCSLLSSGMWLLLASGFGLPVSTTHSTVGAIIGFTVASQGWSCVKWGLDGFASIVLSWFVSPVVSGVICSIVYFCAVKFVVKAEHPMQRGFQAIPILLCVSLVTVLSLIFFKSPATKDLDDWISYLVVGLIGTISLVGGYFFGKPVMLKFIEWRDIWRSKKGFGILGSQQSDYDGVNDSDDEEIQKLKPKTSPKDLQEKHQDKPQKNKAKEKEEQEDDAHEEQLNNDDNDKEDPGVALETGAEVENTEELTERKKKEKEVDAIFSFFQVFTACFQSFAHGANDVANAVGPFVTVWFLYTKGEPSKEVTPLWILAVGGLGIVVGLATFGRAVMETIGKKITHVNFCRGFSIELSTTLAVVVASRLGFPISTTHCGVGAVLGVGLTNLLLSKLGWAPTEDVLKKRDTGVSGKVFLNIAMSWLVTVPISAVGSAGFFSFFVRFLVSEWNPFPTNSTNTTVL